MGFNWFEFIFIEQMLSFLTLEQFLLLVNVVIGNIVPCHESSIFWLAILTRLFAWCFRYGKYHLQASLKYVRLSALLME